VRGTHGRADGRDGRRGGRRALGKREMDRRRPTGKHARTRLTAVGRGTARAVAVVTRAPFPRHHGVRRAGCGGGGPG